MSYIPSFTIRTRPAMVPAPFITLGQDSGKYDIKPTKTEHVGAYKTKISLLGYPKMKTEFKVEVKLDCFKV